MNGYEKIIRTKISKGVEKMFSYLDKSGIHTEFMKIEVRFEDGSRDIYQRYDKNGEMDPASGAIENRINTDQIPEDDETVDEYYRKEYDSRCLCCHGRGTIGRYNKFSKVWQEEDCLYCHGSGRREEEDSSHENS